MYTAMIALASSLEDLELMREKRLNTFSYSSADPPQYLSVNFLSNQSFPELDEVLMLPNKAPFRSSNNPFRVTSRYCSISQKASFFRP